MSSSPDHVDRLRAQWAREMPHIDTDHMAIFGRILRIGRLIDAPVSAVMAAHGIDRGEFDVLAALRRSGAPFILSPTQLYKSLMLSSGGVTHRLKRLQERDLITRLADPEDGRSQLVQLTKRGHATVEAALRDDSAFEAPIVQALGSEDFAELERLLRRLTHIAETTLGSPPRPA